MTRKHRPLRAVLDPPVANCAAGQRGLRSAWAVLAYLTLGLAVPAWCAPEQAVSKDAASTANASMLLEQLTWTEVHDRVAKGSTTILVPIGGTEQNGPYMVLGKHNVRARQLALAIAEKLGDTLVAPVIAYVPEGSISPPSGHMRFSGTISISDAGFEAVLEGTARSFKQAGFRHVFFLGDHGGYRRNLERVATRLNAAWRGDPACRVHALPEYYLVTQDRFVSALQAKGYGRAEIGTHAGLADTSLALAIDPTLVRREGLARAPKLTAQDGVLGDPHRASAELGQAGIALIVRASVDAIRQQLHTTP